MENFEFELLYKAYVQYVEDAYREHERLGTRAMDSELRTGKARSREQFRVLLDRLNRDPVVKDRYISRLKRGFAAESDFWRARFKSALGQSDTGSKKTAA